ncbi:MAG: glutamine synthetase beta-grasp domain-containing protein, partial [Polyangiaceae bacterium]|nr:glutamine synthetase beta-grasp domain-containing protein [Polyangiaceae bacterium]
MNPSEVLKMCKDEGVVMVDFKFCDFLGTLQHFSVPVEELAEETFEEGLGFDGSSIRGWQAINESDMLVMPDPATAFIDPFCQHPTLSLLCNITDPITREKYSRDPRNVALKAEAYLRSTGIADTAYFGPEPEFFIFDSVRFSSEPKGAFYHLDSEEAPWNSGVDTGVNLGQQIKHKQGYFPATPADRLMDLRSEITTNMQTMGMEVDLHHHEVASPGQCEIGIKFGTAVTAGDLVHQYKYAVKNTCYQHGKTATFMPKPMFGDNGSGMHCH